MSRITTAERCQGVLIGLAAGDRIGGPISMAVRLAESLLDCDGFDPIDILSRYLHWWREEGFDTGPVSERAFRLMASGVPASDVAGIVHQEVDGKTAGCNPAHRSPPLSMLAPISDEDLERCAVSEARLTHYDPLAGEVAAAVNAVCRALIRGSVWEDAERTCSRFVAKEQPSDNGGFAPDVLRAAMFFVGISDSFDEALERGRCSLDRPTIAPFWWEQSLVLAGGGVGLRKGVLSRPRSSEGSISGRCLGCEVVMRKLRILVFLFHNRRPAILAELGI